MRISILAAVCAVVSWLALAGFSFAQAPSDWPVLCGPAEAILGALKNRYGERPTGQGTFDGQLYQMWENRENDTWTFVLVMPGGGVCALAFGEDWRPLPVPGDLL